ncbi:MAG: Ig-like domain-containing protein, partial [Bacteroidota bacterium]
MGIEFNFKESSFDGSLRVFLDAGPLKGGGENGELVHTQLYFSRQEWFIYVGTPDQPCSIEFDVPFVGGLKASAYLDIGTNVPSMPDPPQTVQEIAYKLNRNTSFRQSGAGFVLGASLDIHISVGVGFIAQGTIDAAAGFDLMLKKYNNLHCQGSNESVGIDGWYGSGQLWAYMQGGLKVLGVNIFKLGIAAILQTRLPNPFWAQATVGVRVKFLLFTFNKSVKFEVGSDCILVSDDPIDELGMPIIVGIDPFNSAVEVPTDVVPTVSLAVDLGEPVEATPIEGPPVTFVATYKEAILADDQGMSVPITRITTGGQLQFLPDDMLKGSTQYTFTIRIDVSKDGSHLTTEEQSVTFTTAESFNYIPESNVTAVYPVGGMTNYYKNEVPGHEGFIQLKVGQPDILFNIPNHVVQQMQLTDTEGNVVHFDYEYDAETNRIVFPLDPTLFQNESLYHLELVRAGKNSTSTGTGVVQSRNSGGFSNIGATIASLANSGDLLAVALGSRELGTQPPVTDGQVGGTSEIPTTTLYEMYFRVSKYNTLIEKVADINQYNSINERTKYLEHVENFDALEISGNYKYEPLVKFTSDIQNPWIHNFLEEYDGGVIFPAMGVMPSFSYYRLIQIGDHYFEAYAFPLDSAAEQSTTVFGATPNLITPEIFAGEATYNPQLQYMDFLMEEKTKNMIVQFRGAMQQVVNHVETEFKAFCEDNPTGTKYGCPCEDESNTFIPLTLDGPACYFKNTVGEHSFDVWNGSIPNLPIGEGYDCFLSYHLPDGTATSPGAPVNYIKATPPGGCTDCH